MCEGCGDTGQGWLGYRCQQGGQQGLPGRATRNPGPEGRGGTSWAKERQGVGLAGNRGEAVASRVGNPGAQPPLRFQGLCLPPLLLRPARLLTDTQMQQRAPPQPRVLPVRPPSLPSQATPLSKDPVPSSQAKPFLAAAGHSYLLTPEQASPVPGTRCLSDPRGTH